ncbi:unnamed protein product [Cylindrotheca closterium]|uniref:Uncharacterized protein n=1 Tax=Cylindrotheca closterium TaxID=2856 RepID=A0AAD2G0R0_9STRA|nr:unnamed protein product [Cylindrotheca closterium]
MSSQQPQAVRFRYLPDTLKAQVPKHVTHAIIDSSVTFVDKEAFSRKRKLLEVIFGSSSSEQNSNLLTIGYDAFSNCRLLSRLHLPTTVIEIRDDAFANGKSLVEVKLPHGLKWIGERTFADCTSLKLIQIPSTVEELGFRIFVNCRNLVSVELTEGLLVIGEKVFEHCTSLRNVAVPSTVEVVEANAFLNCLKLEQRFPYTDELHEALRHRFDDCPLHRICYEQAFPQVNATAMELDDMQWSTETASLDCFGMTPLHMLSLSTVPNVQLLKDLLQQLPNRTQLACTKDRWNQSPYDYLFLELDTNKTSGARELMEHMIEVTLLHPTQSLGLDRWRRDIWNRVDFFQTNNEANTLTADRIHTAYEKLSHYWQLEIYSLLELAIWESTMDEQRRQGEVVDRQGCRIQCGVQVILPHVMAFLKDQDWLVVGFGIETKVD